MIFVIELSMLWKGCNFIVMSQERKNYLYDYQKKKLKRVPLDLKLEDYDNLKSAAEQAGQTVNGYIKQAIAEKMEREAGE